MFHARIHRRRAAATRAAVSTRSTVSPRSQRIASSGISPDAHPPSGPMTTVRAGESPVLLPDRTPRRVDRSRRGRPECPKSSSTMHLATAPGLTPTTIEASLHLAAGRARAWCRGRAIRLHPSRRASRPGIGLDPDCLAGRQSRSGQMGQGPRSPAPSPPDRSEAARRRPALRRRCRTPAPRRQRGGPSRDGVFAPPTPRDGPRSRDPGPEGAARGPSA